MKKGSHYLWRNGFSTQEEYEKTKEHFLQLGFYVTTFIQEKNDRNIHEGMKALLQNHMSDIKSDSGKGVIS